MATTLSQYLAREESLHELDPVLARLITSVSEACKTISHKVRQGALAGVLGLAGTENVQGEDQKKLDIISNDIFVDAVVRSGAVCGMVSEEIPGVMSVPDEFPVGPYLIAFDPLDGSSNIDINVSIGSIFSVTPAVRPKRTAVDADFLQPGRNQVAAGYCMYGPQTQLCLTFGRGVVFFTLDPSTGTFVLTQEDVRVARYIDELLAGKAGPRGKDFNMRWVAAMVAEVHRILQRGGIFLYPRDNRDPAKPGKLRLLYEANPMSMIMENAGGASTNGHTPILDIVPEKIHQRVAVMLGAREEVDLVTSYHKA